MNYHIYDQNKHCSLQKIIFQILISCMTKILKNFRTVSSWWMLRLLVLSNLLSQAMSPKQFWFHPMSNAMLGK